MPKGTTALEFRDALINLFFPSMKKKASKTKMDMRYVTPRKKLAMGMKVKVGK